MRFEDFTPRLRSGRLTPHNEQIIYETEKPYKQIIFPIHLTDFIMLCDGELSVKEIISTLYKKNGSVPFKAIFHSLFRLKEKGFLENGDELEDQKKNQEFSSTRVWGWPSVQVTLTRRISNNRIHPLLFYILSMSAIVLAIFSFSSFDPRVLTLPFLYIEGSFFNGLAVAFVAASLLLSFKNLFKALLQINLVGRVYNTSLRFNGLALYFSVDSESSYLITNRLFLFLFHLSSSLIYFVVALGYDYFNPGSLLYPHMLVIAIALTLTDLSPYGKSELNSFFSNLYEDDFLSRLSDYLKSKSLLKLIDPNSGSHDQNLFFAFSHFALLWVVASLYLYYKLSLETFAALARTLTIGSVPDLLAGGIFSIIWIALGLFLLQQLVQSIYANGVLPVSNFMFSRWRGISTKKNSSKDVDMLLTQLRALPLFSYFNGDDLRALIEKSQLLDFAKGTRVIVQGDLGRDLYVLLDGVLHVQRRESVGWIHSIGEIRPISIFGETALIEQGRRTAEVVCKKPAQVLSIPADEIRKVAKDSGSGAELNQFKYAIMINQYFTFAPLFRELSQDTVQAFLLNGEVEEFPPGAVIFRQDSLGDSFYLIIRGSVDVIINEVEVNKIRQGGFFGEISVITDVARTATIATNEPTITLKVSADSFWQILSQNMEIALFIEAIGEKRLREDVEFLESSDL